MRWLRLKRLSWCNFRSFLGEHSLELPDAGVINVRGRNRATGDDSGSGKTNLVLALQYLFGCCRFSARSLQSWDTDEPFWVQGDCESSDGDVRIRRGPKGLQVGKLRGKAAEAELLRLCGAGERLREALTYRDQVKPKRFLDMADGALKEFLVQVLPHLAWLDAEIEKVTRDEKDLVAKRETADVYRSNCANDLERERESLDVEPDEDLGSKEMSAARVRGEVTTLAAEEEAAAIVLELARRATMEAKDRVGSRRRAAIAAAEAALRAHLAEPAPATDRSALEAAEADLAQCDGFIGQLEAIDHTRLAAHEAETDTVRQELTRLHNELAEVPQVRDDLARLRAEAAELEADLCAMCQRPWARAQELLAATRRTIATREARLRTVEAHRPRLRGLEELLAGRRFEPDGRIARLRTVRDQLLERRAAEVQRLSHAARAREAARAAERRGLESELALERAGLAAELAALDADPGRWQEAQAAAREAGRRLDAAQDSLRELEHRLELARQANTYRVRARADRNERVRRAELALESAELQEKMQSTAWATAADYLDLLTGFRHQVYGEVLAAIGAEATEVVAGLPNAQHLTLEYRLERETQKGTTQERIAPVVFVRGQERPLDEALSGGQLTSVALAVDLAVARVVQRRLGCDLRWLTLDECFNGHDRITREGCLRILQQWAADRVVLVVDHASELREGITKVVTVEFDGRSSRLA